jgi:thiol-disulfide isomerase/thioredoxin
VLAAPASAAKQELSPRVTVQGKALPAEGDKVGSPADPAVGLTVPTLVGEGFNGKPVSVEQGPVPRLVIFLAHWCPHCRAEVPLLVKLAKQGKLDGIEIDTIATNTSKDYPNYPPSKWLKREHWPFTPVLADDAKARGLAGFGGTSFPYFVFVNADGTVAARTSGELPKNTIVSAVERLKAGESLFQ